MKICILCMLLTTWKPNPDILTAFHATRVDPPNSGYTITTFSRPDTQRICPCYSKVPPDGESVNCVRIFIELNMNAQPGPDIQNMQPGPGMLCTYRFLISMDITESATTVVTDVFINFYVHVVRSHHFHTMEIICHASIVC